MSSAPIPGISDHFLLAEAGCPPPGEAARAFAEGQRRPSGPVPALRPLGDAAGDPCRSREAELRLTAAWTKLVGPVLATRSRLLAAREGSLVLGCWDPALLSELRRSAEASWPTLRRRIHTQFGIVLNTLRVEPCDPPALPLPPPPAEDPLGEVLRRFRAKVKQGLAPPMA